MNVAMRAAGLLLSLMVLSCVPDPDGAGDPAIDVHSFANSADTRVTHIDLDLSVDFEARQLRGACTLDIEGSDGDIVLDTRDLAIDRVEVSDDGESFLEAAFRLATADPVLGAALRIERGGASKVRVTYSTHEQASGLQWLEPAQTAGGKHPFLYSQSQAIHARSWIPLQDSPGVRVTYSARIRTPPGLRAVMSAESVADASREGDYRFRMPLPIPSYLIAIGVGDLAFQATGGRTGVYAEPGVVEAAAREFEDTEAMMRSAEALYGPYRWGRYDILVLPPAFPYGGMENPRLTFVSPTVIAGDKSLVSLVAHELAHSWSGNLATNATWRDFWLNEGFTVYFEERIQEAVYGPARAAMDSSLEIEELKQQMAEMDERDQVLHADLAGRDPEEGVTGVPYVKGAMFLRTLEKAVGRDAFDPFLRAYFEEFAFRGVTTGQFAEFLESELLSKHREAARGISVRAWIEDPGLPGDRHEHVSAALDVAAQAARDWADGRVPADGLDTAGWTTQHWLRFLRSLPEPLGAERMAGLDEAFGFTDAGNAEILCEWLVLSVGNGYEPADSALERFLTSVGRMKFLRPIYRQLMRTEPGRERASEIFERARAGYHPVAIQMVERVFSAAEPATN